MCGGSFFESVLAVCELKEGFELLSQYTQYYFPKAL